MGQIRPGDDGHPQPLPGRHRRSDRRPEVASEASRADAIGHPEAQDFQSTHLVTPLIPIGDFNAYEFTDGYVDVIGQIRGQVDASQNLVSGPDLVDPNLTNQVLSACPLASVIRSFSAAALRFSITP